MSHLFMPAGHTDADLVLASQIADAIESDELFVAWTLEGGVTAAPEVQATILPGPGNPFAAAWSGFAGAVRSVWNLLFRPGQERALQQAEPRPRTSRSELEGADL